jgi:NAD(P)-dependent dehydrogenase (short-subunit alcohol dehydrogenase family)
MDKIDLSRFSLEGRTAIITGGSGGIGRACASAFAKAGANIVIASLPPDSIPPVVEEIEALGVKGLGLAIDVADAQQVESLVDETLARFGRVDVLVNVAGGSYSRNDYMPTFKRAPLLDLSPEDFMMAYSVNTKSAFLCAKAVVPTMKAIGKGSIINIGSISGRGTKKERADMAAYGTAKAAVMNLTIHMGTRSARQLHRSRHYRHTPAAWNRATRTIFGSGKKDRPRTGRQRRRSRQRGFVSGFGRSQLCERRHH